MKDSDHFMVWAYLLLRANHSRVKILINDKLTELMPGEFITSRGQIEDDLGRKINNSKIQRILSLFEISGQIEQSTSNHNRIIKILNWKQYQGKGRDAEEGNFLISNSNDEQQKKSANDLDKKTYNYNSVESEQRHFEAQKKFENNTPKFEQQNEQQNLSATDINKNTYENNKDKSEQQTKQQTNSKRTASEQQVNTDKNDKNDKNVEVVDNSINTDNPLPLQIIKLFSIWSKAPTNGNKESTERLIKQHGISRVESAFRIASDAGEAKCNIRYVEGILKTPDKQKTSKREERKIGA